MIIILFLNWFVAFIKIAYGYYSNTLSISTDGYHSLFDGVSNIIGIIGITFASKPRDRSHPYGYFKIETLSAIVIALMLFFVGFEVISAALGRFSGTAVPNVGIDSFIIMIITIIINIGVSTYEAKKGKELKSDLLISDSKHTRSDIFASLAIIIGLVVIQYGYTILDPIMSLFIALIILKAGIDILSNNVSFLMDKNIIPPEKIHEVVDIIPGVTNVHYVRTRGTPSNVLIDMHLVVKSDLTIAEAHDIAHKCEDALYDNFENTKDVVIHIEPETGLEYKVIYEDDLDEIE